MIDISVDNEIDVMRRLALLRMPRARQRRMLKKMARSTIRSSKSRIDKQQGIDNKPWPSRKGKSRRKMLRGLKKGMVDVAAKTHTDVTYRNSVTGKIARAHQEGIDEVMSREHMQRRYGEPDYDAPATRKQARALRDEGYKVKRKNGRGYKKPTIRWIVENLTLGQAGLILRMMREKAAQSRWVIPLPERSFLGANEKEINEMMNSIVNQTINARA